MVAITTPPKIATMDKRGFNSQEALLYLGIKRRAFDKHFRPHVAAMRLGTSVIFDRIDLDRAGTRRI